MVQGIQNGKLNSPDGAVFLMAQPDGNLVLYNTAKYYGSGGPISANAIWGAGSGGAAGSPFRLVMQPDCNLVLYSIARLQQYGQGSSRAAVWASNTYMAGTGPCSAVVSSAGGGSLSVLDSAGVVLFHAPSSAPVPEPTIVQHRFNPLQTGARAPPLTSPEACALSRQRAAG